MARRNREEGSENFICCDGEKKDPEQREKNLGLWK